MTRRESFEHYNTIARERDNRILATILIRKSEAKWQQTIRSEESSRA